MPYAMPGKQSGHGCQLNCIVLIYYLVKNIPTFRKLVIVGKMLVGTAIACSFCAHCDRRISVECLELSRATKQPLCTVLKTEITTIPMTSVGNNGKKYISLQQLGGRIANT